MKNLIPILLFSLCMSCNSIKKEKQIATETPKTETQENPTSNVPNIKSPEPIIYLADNLDERDQLGYCIDTKNRGFNDTLHVHSCKPNGDDVLFYYDDKTQQICSATYPGFCAAMLGGPKIGMTISLVKSDPQSSKQKFIYNKESGEFRPKEDSNLCLAAGSESDDAGPYMSRALSLQPCESTDKSLKTWVIKGKKTM
ncbi:RICIN domain-containing protein [Winogradskyella eckloniae]|uniref:RICIN domain-containing protein n=1 Tax=Winogradskyella eckloniae TaxID=1089306 RepID=UPI00156439AB|nr:RICIN domain-containing protein [Winogradskyella eckloniae]NRD20945.1 RICIN domain-containing protein [Winogradskyella eckloniae]